MLLRQLLLLRAHHRSFPTCPSLIHSRLFASIASAPAAGMAPPARRSRAKHAPPSKAVASRGKKRAADDGDADANAAAAAPRAPRPPRPSKKQTAASAPAAAPPPRKRQPKPAAAPDAAAAPAPAPAAAAAAPTSPQYWLVKSEPHEYSADDLAANKGGGRWDGVRNYSARNHLRAMRRGDLCLFYHSSCAVPGYVAVARVTTEAAYADPTAEEVGGRYYDAKHTPDAPRWWCVDLELERRAAAPVTLSAIKARAGKGGDVDGGVLAGMALLTRPRLSVQPVTPAEWAVVMRMEREAAAAAAKGAEAVKDEETAAKGEEEGAGAAGGRGAKAAPAAGGGKGRGAGGAKGKGR